MKKTNDVCSFRVNPVEHSEHVDYNRKEYPFYIRRGLLSTYPNHSAVSHWHEDLEFIVILSGHMVYNVNGTAVALPEGSGIFVNSRQFHHGYSTDYAECEFICIILHPLLLCINEFFENTYVQPVISNTEHPYQLFSEDVPWQKQTLELLRKLYRQCDTCGYLLDDAALHAARSNVTPSGSMSLSNAAGICTDDAVLKIQHLLFGLWLPLYQNLPKQTGQPGKPNRQLSAVKQMVTFIRSHYKEPLSLSQIADAGNVCKSSCSALFHKYLSQTPITYLTEYRLRRSLELLFHTDLSVTEISYEVGFNSASYYAETFRKYYQCTPTEYAKMHRQP